MSYNPNPYKNRVGDCTVRAISKAMGQDWEKTYMDLCLQGFLMGNMPTDNDVWGAYLREHGFTRKIIPEDKPVDYTVEDFCKDHPKGEYILAISGHVVAVQNGDYYDSWNSGNEVPVYYWMRKEQEK